MSIGSKIADRRKELGMTQQDLVEKLDVSFQAVSSWEREESRKICFKEIADNKLASIVKVLDDAAMFLQWHQASQKSEWLNI